MIPGKQYKPEDFVAAAWRRRWVILLPFVVIATTGVVLSQLPPDTYRSEARLQIVPQRVPENLVRPTVTMRLDERLVQSIAQQIQSRTQLEKLIQEFNLYPKERKTKIMEDVVEAMRTKIHIGRATGTREDSGVFVIGFDATDARTAMAVAERLSSLIISGNLEDRAVFADMTDQFVQSQLEEARRQLKDHEAKLAQFRMANPGRMPQEMEATQQALANTQAQAQALNDSIGRDRDQQLMIQRMIADASNMMAATPATGESAEQPSATAKQLEQAKAQLRILQMRLKPTHPDIALQKRAIAQLEQKAAAEALEQPVSPPATASAPSPLDTRLSDLRAEQESLERRIVAKQETAKQLLATMQAYQQRIDSVPGVESRLTELMRDYTTLQATYQSLLSKSQEAKVAANLERRNIGEQFKILDPARLPPRPISPNRPLMMLAGAVLGLGLGLGLAALLEYRDTSLRTEDDVIVALSLPVLALVPTMVTASDRQRQRRRRMLAGSGALAALVLSLVVLVWKYPAVSGWMR